MPRTGLQPESEATVEPTESQPLPQLFLLQHELNTILQLTIGSIQFLTSIASFLTSQCLNLSRQVAYLDLLISMQNNKKKPSVDCFCNRLTLIKSLNFLTAISNYRQYLGTLAWRSKESNMQWKMNVLIIFSLRTAYTFYSKQLNRFFWSEKGFDPRTFQL